MGYTRRILLFACLGGILCLLGVLAFFSFKSRTSRSPTTTSTPVAQNRAGLLTNATTASSLSRRQLIDRGHEFGRNGDWQKAFECWREVVASGPSSEYEWSYATASALAAGDTNACEQFCVKVMELFGKSTDSGTAERCAKQSLALPSCSDELLEQGVERADFAIRRNQRNRWAQLAKGMADYRREIWESALDWLRQAETSGSIEISLQAWCFGAMTRHQLGDTAGARKALDEVDARVKILLWTGELGRLRDNTWDSIARGMVARVEAEQLILGKVTSPPLNPAEIFQRRQKWQAVSYSLNAADQMGRQSQWVPATQYYSKVLQDPLFNWAVFEMNQDLLPQKMAAAFLMAGDQIRYSDLVRALLARNVTNLVPMMQERYAQIFVCNPELLPTDLKAPALAYARRVCQFPDAETNPWLCLLRGITEYRDGHFDQSISALNQAIFQPSETDGAARAMTYKAMALKRLGRAQEALDATQEANAVFAKHLTRSGDWTNPAFYQLAMKELLTLLASPSEPTKSPQ